MTVGDPKLFGIETEDGEIERGFGFTERAGKAFKPRTHKARQQCRAGNFPSEPLGLSITGLRIEDHFSDPQHKSEVSGVVCDQKRTQWVLVNPIDCFF